MGASTRFGFVTTMKVFFCMAVAAVSSTVSVAAAFHSSTATTFGIHNGSSLKETRRLKGLQALGEPICEYHQLSVPTSQPGPPCQKISVEDLTPSINQLLNESGMMNGVVNVISRHTTTAITINERESRLALTFDRMSAESD